MKYIARQDQGYPGKWLVGTYVNRKWEPAPPWEKAQPMEVVRWDTGQSDWLYEPGDARKYARYLNGK